jgi:hypothetical protein
VEAVSRNLLLLMAFLAFVGAASGPPGARAESAAAAAGAAARFDCPALYDAGSYEEAALCFEALERQGHRNGHVVYNQGNAWYRAGRLGPAILAWRRALLFLPRDGDLHANLRSARERVRDALEPPDRRAPLARALLVPYDALSRHELLVLGALAWALALSLGAVALWRGRPALATPALAAGALALLALLGAAVRSYQEARHPVAVVLAEELTLRSGRDLQSVDLSRLHEGAELRVLERAAGWLQVGLSNGQRGWVPADAVGLAGPDAYTPADPGAGGEPQGARAFPVRNDDVAKRDDSPSPKTP